MPSENLIQLDPDVVMGDRVQFIINGARFLQAFSVTTLLYMVTNEPKMDISDHTAHQIHGR